MNLKHVKSFKRTTILFTCLLLVLFLGLQLNAKEKQVVEKTFAAKKLMVIKTICGDCSIEKGSSDKITLKLVHNFSTEYYEPIFKEEGDRLVMEENFKQNHHHSNNGSSHWTVTVPENTKIEAYSASGDIMARDIKSDINSKTASGDIHVENMKDVITIKTASGDVTISKSEGKISVDCVSGDVSLSAVTGTLSIHSVSGEIEAEGIQLNAVGSFKSVSGDINVKLIKSIHYDTSFSTISGDIKLDYAGNPIKGYFKFKGMKGNITSDISLNDNENTSKYNPFITKHFTQGGDTPEVSFDTVSGNISFKK